MRKIRIIAAFLSIMFIFNSLAVFAEMPKGSIVIGNRAYSLKYANGEENVDEIRNALKKGREQGIFIKNMRGDWYENSTGEKSGTSKIPTVILKNDNGKYELFSKKDGKKTDIEVLITEDNKNIVGKTIEGNIYIESDNVTIKDSEIKGKIIINPGVDGVAKLENISTEEIIIFSGGEDSIHLKDVKANKVSVDSISNVRVESKGNTDIKKTVILSDMIFDAASGTFGEIVVDTKDSESTVVFRGTFKEEIIVKSSVKIVSSENTSINKVIIDANSEEGFIEIEGDVDSIDINKESNILLNRCTVKTIHANADAKIDISKDSSVDKIASNGKNIDISGEGIVKEGMTLPAVGGGAPASGGGSGIIEPKPEPKPDPKPIGKTTPAAIIFNISEEQINLNVGEEKFIDAKVQLVDGSFEELKAWVNKTTESSISWTTDNKEVARVNNDGKVTAVAEGTAKINVNLKHKELDFNNSIVVNVNEVILPEVQKVTIKDNSEKIEMRLGEKRTFQAEVLFKDKTTSAAVTWRLDDSNVGELNKGELSVLRPGNTNLIASFSRYGVTMTDKVQVSVEKPKEIYTLNGIIDIDDNESRDIYSMKVEDEEENKVAMFIGAITPIHGDVKVHVGQNQTVELVDMAIIGDISITGTGTGTVILNNVIIADSIRGKIAVEGLEKNTIRLVRGTCTQELNIHNPNARIDIQDAKIGVVNAIGNDKSTGNHKIIVEISDESQLSDVVASTEDFIVKDNTTDNKNLSEVINLVYGDDINLEDIVIESSEKSNLMELGKQINTIEKYENKLKDINELFESRGSLKPSWLFDVVGKQMKLLVESLHKMDIKYEGEEFKLPEEYFEFSPDVRTENSTSIVSLLSERGSKRDTISELKEIVDYTMSMTIIHIEMEKIKGIGMGDDSIDASKLKAGDKLVDILSLKDGKTPIVDFYSITPRKLNTNLVVNDGEDYYLTRNYLTRIIGDNYGSETNHIKVPFNWKYVGEKKETLLGVQAIVNASYAIIGLPLVEDRNIEYAEIIKNDDNFKILVTGTDVEGLIKEDNIFFNDMKLQVEKLQSKTCPEGEMLFLEVVNSESIEKLDGILKIQFGENRQYEYVRRFDLNNNSEFDPKYVIQLEGKAEEAFEIKLDELEKSSDFSKDNQTYLMNVLLKDMVSEKYLSKSEGLWGYITHGDDITQGIIEGRKGKGEISDNRAKIQIPLRILKDTEKDIMIRIFVFMEDNQFERVYKLVK